jgi:hypothetical protein
MTPADEARFIELWQQGVDSATIGQQLGIPRGTVGSRAATLVRQGKISPRPRGGAYPKQKALARLSPDGTPAPPATPTAPAPPAPQVAPATPAVTFVAVPEIQEILSIVKELQTRVASLEQTRVPPALPATPAPPAAPAAERKDIQQWTVRLSKALIDHLKAVAYERHMPPSQLVEELVWKALTDHQPSTPK